MQFYTNVVWWRTQKHGPYTPVMCLVGFKDYFAMEKNGRCQYRIVLSYRRRAAVTTISIHIP